MIYERLKLLCKEKGTSPTAVCVRITGSKGNLENWKEGKIKSSVLIALCEYLDCSSDFLLGISDIKEPAAPLREQLVDDAISDLIDDVQDLTEEEAAKVREFAQLLKLKRKQQP